jgi:hypothetical protein
MGNMVHEKSAPIRPEVLEKENPRFILIEDPRFTVYGEFKEDNLFIHCSRIKKWSRSTYQACLEAVSAIKTTALSQGYDHIFGVTFLHKMKFATMMGFTPIQIYTDNKGRPFVLCVQHTDGSPVECVL